MKLPAGARKVTDFESTVYSLCAKVPPGKVTTYGEIAGALASSARAVGQAMRRNPFAPTVPCHRVVSADLKLGGYFGAVGEQSLLVKKKQKMLMEEGVEFEDPETISTKSFFKFNTKLQHSFSEQRGKNATKVRSKSASGSQQAKPAPKRGPSSRNK